MQFTDSTKGGIDQQVPEAVVLSKTTGLDQGRPREGSKADDNGRHFPVTVTNRIPPEPQLQSQPPQPATAQTTMNGVGATTTVSKRAPTDRVAVKRSKSYVDGKTLTSRPNNCRRAIVEVLDRVDTPQMSSASAMVDDGVNRNAEESAVSRPTAFSIIPTGGRDDDRTCECPNCRKKPSRSTSSKCLFTITINSV